MKDVNPEFRMFPEARLGAEVARVLQAEIRNAIRRLSARTTPAPKRIHEARKACKRFRAILAYIRSTQPKIYAHGTACFRDCGRRLSSLRDATVMVVTLDRLGVRFRGKIDGDDLEMIRGVVRSHQQKVMSDSTRIEETLGRVALQMGSAATRLRRTDIGGLTVSDLRAATVRGYRRSRRFSRKHDLSDRQLHRWRKRTKIFACQSSLIHFLQPRIMDVMQQKLEALADLLGELHDLSELGAFLRRKSRGPLAKPAAAVRRFIRIRRCEFVAKARKLGKLSFSQKPSAIKRELSHWIELKRETYERMVKHPDHRENGAAANGWSGGSATMDILTLPPSRR